MDECEGERGGPANGRSDGAGRPEGPVAREARRRDARGRFSVAGSRLRLRTRAVAGVRGPTYLAKRTQTALARICMDLADVVGRLEAEARGEEWSFTTIAPVARMSGIRKLQSEHQARRLEVLDEVLLEMSEKRLPLDMPGRHLEIAHRMRARLDGVFHWRTLYTAPFRDRWARSGSAEDTRSTRPRLLAGQVSRLSKPLLTHRILRLLKRRDELLVASEERLLVESVSAAWVPISPPHRSASFRDDPPVLD